MTDLALWGVMPGTNRGLGAIVIGKLSVAASVTMLFAFSAWGEVDREKLLERGAAETVRLRRGESFPINPLKLTSGTLFDVTAGEDRILLRVTPDGFMQFVETGARAKVTVRGSRKNKVSFELQAGELVSVWPMIKIKLSTDTPDQVIVDASASGWAFVVRAEEVRKGGLPTLVDGSPVILTKGQRLDADIDARTKRVVFRRTGQSWPGKPVAVRAVRVHGRGAEEPTVVIVAEPTLPGVLLDREREFPWQTIPLPVLAWEVFRPPDVSP